MRTDAGRTLLLLGALCASGCGDNSIIGGPTPGPSGPSTGCSSGTPVSGIPALSGRLVVSGLRAPLDLQSVPSDTERLYVVEQDGRIRVVRNGQIAATFLDIAGRLSSGGERGLLGLAFHPQFATNRRFFVNYTNPAGDTHIAEFRASSADAADPASERILLVVGQPFANHNGGGLAFDNAGRLLIALGDGGSGGDPMNNGQRLDTLLGKILRIDVDSGVPYGLPADNPFLATPGARGEIWAYGLRNPFKIAIDRPTGDLYIADVGQNRIEEVDVDPGSRRSGLNYGWRLTEGSQCFNPASGCSTAGLTPPVYEYTHSEGCSITGGVVYRGCRIPALAGTYFFADYCSALVRSFRCANGQATELRDWTSSLRGLNSPTSFGLDAAGELYVVDQDGEVYRLEPS